MEVESTNFGDWANSAFEVLSNTDDKWPMDNNQNTFTIPPSLLSHHSIERFGQITPPEELSPAEPRESNRESSIPLQQLQNEPLFPDQNQLQALQDYQPPRKDASEFSEQEHKLEPSPKRRRTRQPSGTRPQTHATPSHPQPDSTPAQPKRKRGRPKSSPQTVEAFTADGYPVPVSSARESHLEKNRVAAHKCRQRKKEYINGLEGRAREFTAKNKALRDNVALLREEVLELKNEVLRHANCGFWAVDEYLTRCAGDLLGIEAPAGKPGSQKQSPPGSPTARESRPNRESSAESLPSHGTMDSPDDAPFGLDLLQDFDEEMEGGDI